MTEYIGIKNCRVADGRREYLGAVSWSYRAGETWLVTGGNTSGKEYFAAALAGELRFVPDPSDAESAFSSVFAGKSLRVSLDLAAALIAEERRRDESDFAPDGADIGRTVRAYLCEVIDGGGAGLERYPEVKLAGIEKILERGLKYLSTGEIRRTLLARALLSRRELLVLSDPFAGIDAASREILFDFFDALARDTSRPPKIVLCSDRYEGIPPSVNRVLEFSGGRVSYNGDRAGYEALLAGRNKSSRIDMGAIRGEPASAAREDSPDSAQNAVLIDMRRVNVAWGDNHVLRDLSWRVARGEHWFIRGPNGSGKTTLLELITGDNMQVFANDVSLFGRRRGTGETLWDIRKKLGVVSYRLHLEYRMVGGTAVEDVVASGFHDSIGLYELKTDTEKIAVAKWLSLAGGDFSRKAREPFSSLSYGEQRALLIIRATVKSAPLLILDEPCHGLDEESRAMALGLLEVIAEEGRSTILHVTHDPAEARPFEKNILELCPGETPMYRTVRA